MAKQCKVKTNDSSIEQWQVRHNGHKFKVADLEDRIILSFDEQNQRFYAYIKNPSSHTRYLYQNGKLGLTLCKLNTGVSQRKHMGVRDTATATTGEDYVKKHYHPRWSRCTSIMVEVDDMGEIIIPINDTRYFRPNQYHSLKGSRWYTYIKAKLVSINPTGYPEWSRAYRSHSNRIPIYGDGNGLYERQTGHGTGPSITYDVSIRPVSDSHRAYYIQLSNLSERAQELFNAGRMFVATRYIDVRTRNTGGNGKRANWGLGDDPEPENRRWAPMFTRKLIMSPDSLERLTSTNYRYDVGRAAPKGVSDLLYLVGHVHQDRDPLSITRTAYIVVGYKTGAVLCTTHTIQTDLDTTWYSEDY